MSALVPPARLDAFTTVTGVDLRQLAAAAVAGYDLGTLYVTALDAPDGGLARKRFEERLSAGAIVKQPRPELYRIAGTRAGAPRALVSVQDRVLAVAIGDLTLARVAEAYAERRLKSPTALRGASLSTLPPVPDDALAVLYAPGPFAGAWASAARGLLLSALALDVVLRPADTGTVQVEASAIGDWPEPDAQARLDGAWSELATSSTGRLLGLDTAKNVRSVADLHQLTWSAQLKLAPLVAGLRAATVANVSEMFDVQAIDPTDPPAETQPAP